MVRDERSRSDWTRQFDSVFKPRQNLPGSRRGRFLIVFSVFLIAEAAFIISLLRDGQPLGIGGALWAVWLLVCLLWTFLPQLGAAEDAPRHQRTARQVGFWALVAGLLVAAGTALFDQGLPNWWPIVVATTAASAAGIVLGVLEWRRPG